MFHSKHKVEPNPANGSGSSSQQATGIKPWLHRLWNHERPRLSERIHDHGTHNATGDLNKKPLSLWDRAYDNLKAEDPKLMEKYEKLLSAELSNDGT